MKHLHIAPEFSLPLEAVTQTFGILAKRGMGKTVLSSVMVEEMLEAQLPVAIVDPVGVWWGLRSSADGKTPGYPIFIMGGDHGDLPLDKHAGKLVADLIIDQRVPVIVDLSLLRKGEQAVFMTDFCETLYRRNREPLHLVLDEADAFAPQRPMKGQERMLGAVDDIVRRGRARGLGVTLITQRAAVINKDVLTQVEVLVTLRLIAPHDRKAVDEWVKIHGTDDERKELMASLASLPVGTAWWWSPGWLGIFKKVKGRMRRTFDSSATPKVGERKITPKTLSPVDIDKLRAEIEKLAAPAPKKPAVRKQENGAAALDRIKREKELEIALQRAEKRILADQRAFNERIKRFITAMERIYKIAGEFIDAEPDGAPLDVGSLAAPKVGELPKNIVIEPKLRIRKGATRILQELTSRYPAGYSKAQVGTLTKFSPKGGTFNTYLSDLRRAGFIEERDGLIYASEAGVAFLGGDIPQPKTHAEIMDMWRQALRAGAYRMLEVIVASGQIGKEALADDVEMTSSGGTFNTYLSDLRRNGLIVDHGNGSYSPNDILYPERMK